MLEMMMMTNNKPLTTDPVEAVYFAPHDPRKTYKIDATTGNLIWELPQTAGYKLHLDSEDHLLLCDVFAQEVKKLNHDGSVIWTYSTPTDGPWCAAPDLDGNIYVGMNETDGNGGQGVIKLTSDGAFVWKSTVFLEDVYTIHVDRYGYIYATDSDPNAYVVRKLDPVNGSQILTMTHNEYLQYADGNHNDRIILANFYGGNLEIFDNTGTFLFSGDSGPSSCQCGSADGYGDYLFGSESTLVKIDSSGSGRWSQNLNRGNIREIIVDKYGYIYCACNDGLVKLSSDGSTLEWFFANNSATSATRGQVALTRNLDNNSLFRFS